MKTLVIAILWLTAAAATVSAQVTVLANATIIDGTGRPAQPNMTVMIDGGRISVSFRAKSSHARAPSSST